MATYYLRDDETLGTSNTSTADQQYWEGASSTDPMVVYGTVYAQLFDESNNQLSQQVLLGNTSPGMLISNTISFAGADLSGTGKKLRLRLTMVSSVDGIVGSVNFDSAAQIGNLASSTVTVYVYAGSTGGDGYVNDSFTIDYGYSGTPSRITGIELQQNLTPPAGAASAEGYVSTLAAAPIYVPSTSVSASGYTPFVGEPLVLPASQNATAQGYAPSVNTHWLGLRFDNQDTMNVFVSSLDEAVVDRVYVSRTYPDHLSTPADIENYLIQYGHKIYEKTTTHGAESFIDTQFDQWLSRHYVRVIALSTGTILVNFITTMVNFPIINGNDTPVKEVGEAQSITSGVNLITENDDFPQGFRWFWIGKSHWEVESGTKFLRISPLRFDELGYESGFDYYNNGGYIPFGMASSLSIDKTKPFKYKLTARIKEGSERDLFLDRPGHQKSTYFATYLYSSEIGYRHLAWCNREAVPGTGVTRRIGFGADGNQLGYINNQQEVEELVFTGDPEFFDPMNPAPFTGSENDWQTVEVEYHPNMGGAYNKGYMDYYFNGVKTYGYHNTVENALYQNAPDPVVHIITWLDYATFDIKELELEYGSWNVWTAAASREAVAYDGSIKIWSPTSSDAIRMFGLSEGNTGTVYTPIINIPDDRVPEDFQFMIRGVGSGGTATVRALDENNDDIPEFTQAVFNTVGIHRVNLGEIYDYKRIRLAIDFYATPITATVWQPNTYYAAGTKIWSPLLYGGMPPVSSGGYYFEVTTSGVSGSEWNFLYANPAFGYNNDVLDGSLSYSRHQYGTTIDWASISWGEFPPYTPDTVFANAVGYAPNMPVPAPYGSVSANGSNPAVLDIKRIDIAVGNSTVYAPTVTILDIKRVNVSSSTDAVASTYDHQVTRRIEYIPSGTATASGLAAFVTIVAIGTGGAIAEGYSPLPISPTILFDSTPYGSARGYAPTVYDIKYIVVTASQNALATGETPTLSDIRFLLIPYRAANALGTPPTLPAWKIGMPLAFATNAIGYSPVIIETISQTIIPVPLGTAVTEAFSIKDFGDWYYEEHDDAVAWIEDEESHGAFSTEDEGVSVWQT